MRKFILPDTAYVAVRPARAPRRAGADFFRIRQAA